MKLSACMIVKNEEKILEKSLPSLSRYADEIILVDTGSSDETIEVAGRFGAKICRFPWINDFSAARNQSLQYASGDWILWVDADEFFKEEDLKQLRSILEGSKEEAYTLTIYESDFGKCEKKVNYPRVKVFRNKKGYHFVRPINEQLISGEGEVARGPSIPVAIYHWGRFLEAERMKAKRECYLKLYSKALEKSPNDPYFHFLLANLLKDLGRAEEALTHYRKVVEFSNDRNVVRKSLEKIAQALLNGKDFKAASQAAKELVDYDPENIPARNIFASLFLLSRNADAAIELLTEVLEKKIKGPIENPYQVQALPNILLGQAYMLKQEKDKAEEFFMRARKLYPYMGGEN